ncbi:MAG TPA: hypothetical protein VLA51_00765 [Paracoccaceae bacterium]|nr:hypothetical protein [Paracoccaceae bacterium]
MSIYEMSLLGGTVLLCISVFLFFSASWQSQPRGNSLLAFLAAAGLLLYADTQSLNGMQAGDVAQAVLKLLAVAT